MYKYFTILILAFISLAGKVGGMDQSLIDDINQKLHNPNSQVRIAASESLARGAPEKAGNNILPLFVTALNDPEPQVRYYATTGLKIIAYFTLPKYGISRSDATDIKSYVPLQTALLNVIDDPSEDTRNNALAAYVLAFPVPNEMQDKLAERYNSEKNILIKQTILAALTIDGAPSMKSQILLERLVGDPQTSWKIAQALSAASAPPPDWLLPQLVSQIAVLKEASKRADLARAIVKFGVRAKPYLGQLNAAERQERDPSVKRAMQSYIQAINRSQ